MQNFKENIALLVVSCDKSKDLWKPFFQLFWRFWPDCPLNIYLLSNKIRANIPGIINVSVGDDISWSDNLIKVLRQMKEDYVFLFIEDLFLVRAVQADSVFNIFNWIILNKPNCVKLSNFIDGVPRIAPDKYHNEVVGELSGGINYRVSTVMTVWKRTFLENLLKEGESAWEFEKNGSIRSDKFGGFFCTYDDYFPVINCMVRGKWRRNVLGRIRKLGVEIDLTKRDIMSLKETIFLYSKVMISILLICFPSRYRRRIKTVLRPTSVVSHKLVE